MLATAKVALAVGVQWLIMSGDISIPTTLEAPFASYSAHNSPLPQPKSRIFIPSKQPEPPEIL